MKQLPIAPLCGIARAVRHDHEAAWMEALRQVQQMPTEYSMVSTPACWRPLHIAQFQHMVTV